MKQQIHWKMTVAPFLSAFALVTLLAACSDRMERQERAGMSGKTEAGMMTGESRPSEDLRSDINLMKAKDFHRFGLTEKQSQAIERYRKEHGKFSSLEDLKKVPGMDSAWVDQHRRELEAG